jgi:hypothetical protein
VVLASWVALAVTKVGTNGDDALRGTARPILFWGLAYNSQRTFQNCWTPRGARAGDRTTPRTSHVIAFSNRRLP